MFTESIIAFSILMFMLSLISERVTNFIKISFQDKTIRIFFPHKKRNANNQQRFWYLKAKIQVLAFKQPAVEIEKKREFRIMVINMIIGIAISVFCNLNLFQAFKEIIAGNDQQALKGWDIDFLMHHLWHVVVGGIYILLIIWMISMYLFAHLDELDEKDKPDLKWLYVFSIFFVIVSILILLGESFFRGVESYSYNIIYHSIGYIFTGIFLSLGSKFWHDLLDILFLFKNTRQRLSERETFTNYSSAQQIALLAETPRYDVVQKLDEKYRQAITEIPGVVSYGINTILDAHTKLYKKRLEVEYTTSAAQKSLLHIQQTGSVNIHSNTFYLKDYLQLFHTGSIEVMPISDPRERILHEDPICYAYNNNSPNNIGSFGLIQKNEDGDYFAVSNLHVFADPEEFKNFEHKPTYQLTNRRVSFKIGNDIFEGEIIENEYRLGDFNGLGLDYCMCAVPEAMVKAYRKYIAPPKLFPTNPELMKMLGATSKYVDFHNERYPTLVKVKYPQFHKELNLLKVKTSKIKNIQKGDSGSIVNYYLEGKNGKKLYRGLIVAKSDFYTYMSGIPNSINPI